MNANSPDHDPVERLGEYRLLREVGRGGMGVVYEAEQVSLGRRVALKILPAHAWAHPSYPERFRREAQAAARLHHSNIVPVFGVGEAEGVHYYAMQFIQGDSLDRVLRDLCRLRDARGEPTVDHVPPPGDVPAERSGDSATGAAEQTTPPSGTRAALSSSSEPEYFRAVARVGVQVADALAYAHRQGVLHRDIKPSNLLLDLHGTIWVTDFGLAKVADGDELTRTGDVVGTLRYMAPERFNGVSLPQGDVYSLGLTLYELLTLRPAFAEPDRHRLIQRIGSADPTPPRAVQPRVPRDLETIVLKASARDPAQRYPTAGDLAEDLRRFIDDRPVQARRASVRERLWRWCRRNPVVAVLGTAVVVLLLLATVSATLTARQAQELARSEGQRAEAETRSRQQAEADADTNRRLVGHQFVDNGVRLMEQGDLSGAALWFAEALRKDGLDPDRAALHRTRVGAVLHECPRPAHVWFHGSKVHRAAYSPDGARVVALCADRAARLYDAGSGALLATLRHDLPLRDATFSGDGRRLITQCGVEVEVEKPWPVREVRIWDTATGRLVAGPLKHLLPGTEHADSHASLSADGTRLLTHAGDVPTMQAWDTTTGKAAGVPWLRWWPLHRPLFTPDGRAAVIVVGAASLFNPKGKTLKTFQLWLVGEARGKQFGQMLRTVEKKSPLREVLDLRLSLDGRCLLVTEDNKQAELLELPSGRRLWTAHGAGKGTVTRVHELSPDGRRLLVSTSTFQQAIWDVTTDRQVGGGFSAGNSSEGGSFSADGRWLLLHVPGSAKLWQVRAADTGAVRADLRHEAAVMAARFSPDGRRVLTVCADRAVRVWDVSSGALAVPILQHEAAVDSAVFSLDGNHVLTVSGQTVRTWPLSAHPPTSAQFRPGSRRLRPAEAVLSRDGRRVLLQSLPAEGPRAVTVWEATTARAVRLDVPKDMVPLQLAFSPDGRYALTAGFRRDAQARFVTRTLLWDAATGRPVSAFEESERRVPAFSPDGSHILTLPWSLYPWISTRRAEARVYEAASGRLLASLVPEEDLQYALFSPDGRRVCLVCEGRDHDTVVRTHDADSGQPLGPPFRAKARVQPVNKWSSSIDSLRGARPLLSEDGRRLLLLGNTVAQVWDIRTGRALTPHLSRGAAAFSRDGRRLVTGAGFQVGRASGPARVWDADTGKPISPILLQEQSVLACAFSPQGDRVVTGGGDGTARVWHAETGEPLMTPLRHPGPVKWVRFSDDGRRLLTVAQARSPGLTVWQAWDARTGQPLTPPLENHVRRVVAGNYQTDFPQLVSQDGNRLLLVRPDDTLEVLTLGPSDRPVADLLAEAQALSARQVSDSAGMLALSADHFRSGWEGSRVRRLGVDRAVAPDVLARARWHAKLCLDARLPHAALPVLDQILAAQPGDVPARRQRAAAYADLGHWKEAVGDYNVLLSGPPRYGPWYERGVCLAHLEQWREAAADFDRAIQLGGGSAAHWSALALARLHQGDTKGYHSACVSLLEVSDRSRFSRPLADDLLALRICTVYPPAKKTLQRLVGRADALPRRGEGSGESPSGRGERAAVYYRAGRPAETVRLLPGLLNREDPGSAPDWFFLALALGQGEEGQAALSRGVRCLNAAEKQRNAEEPGAALRYWQERLCERLLRREAEAALKGNPARKGPNGNTP
jgi:serine/threonine protein kinase/WD40 repeat protein/tetratricopeptide (TPR) repeat protein